MSVVNRGDVRWGPALFKNGELYRPWLVVSDDTHPFATEECLAVGLTTTDHSAGIPVEADDWASGGTSIQSYVSPWYCTTIKHADFDRHQGQLYPSIVETVATQLGQYVGLDR